MVGKYKIITLCGSTRFKDEFMEAQKRLTLEGNNVISVRLFGHSSNNYRHPTRKGVNHPSPAVYSNLIHKWLLHLFRTTSTQLDTTDSHFNTAVEKSPNPHNDTSNSGNDTVFCYNENELKMFKNLIVERNVKNISLSGFYLSPTLLHSDIVWIYIKLKWAA